MYNCFFRLVGMLLLFKLCLMALYGQSNPFQKRYFFAPYKAGTSKFIHTNYYEIEALSDGGFATIGFVTDSSNISQGVLTRYDCTGQPLWTKLLGVSGSPTNTVMGIAETDSADLVFSFPLATGFFQASTLIGRLTRDGKVLWMKRIGRNTEFGRDITATKDGGFIIAGSTGYYGTDATADDIYLVKIDGYGNIVWNRTFGNPSGTYDEAFSVKTDSKDNIIVTGRCIADGTFQAFILKADPSGNAIGFKTFGYNNQRTYAFDLLVDPQDNYLITGSTTILEVDHTSSEYDVFLIKVDSSLKLKFATIYEPFVGGDAGAIGEALTLGPDGRYIIGVSTYAFTTHNASGPNSPSKNALYSINEDGSVYKAFIYNMKGSQYTRVRRTKGGYYLSGFTTAYANNVNFQGLIIKTDENYLSGCNDIEVTSELDSYNELWTVADFSYQSRSGINMANYAAYKDSNVMVDVICEKVIALEPKISGPASVCPGMDFVITDESVEFTGATHTWLLNGKNFETGKKDLTLKFEPPGTYVISKVMTFACVSRQFDLVILVGSYVREINTTGCRNQPFNFYGDLIYNSGSYTKVISNPNACDSLIKLNFTAIGSMTTEQISDSLYCETTRTFVNRTFTRPGTYTFDSIQNCDTIHIIIQLSDGGCDCTAFPNVITPTDVQSGNHKFNMVIPKDCRVRITEIELRIYNRWGALIFESTDPELPGWNGLYKDQPAPADTYTYQAIYQIEVAGQAIQRSFRRSGMFTLVR